MKDARQVELKKSRIGSSEYACPLQERGDGSEKRNQHSRPHQKQREELGRPHRYFTKHINHHGGAKKNSPAAEKIKNRNAFMSRNDNRTVGCRTFSKPQTPLQCSTIKANMEPGQSRRREE